MGGRRIEIANVVWSDSQLGHVKHSFLVTRYCLLHTHVCTQAPHGDSRLLELYMVLSVVSCLSPIYPPFSAPSRVHPWGDHVSSAIARNNVYNRRRPA